MCCAICTSISRPRKSGSISPTPCRASPPCSTTRNSKPALDGPLDDLGLCGIGRPCQSLTIPKKSWTPPSPPPSAGRRRRRRAAGGKCLRQRLLPAGQAGGCRAQRKRRSGPARLCRPAGWRSSPPAIFRADALAALPDRAVAMARLAPEDKFAGLAPARPAGARSFPASTWKTRNEPAAGNPDRTRPRRRKARRWRSKASPIPKAAARASRAAASRSPPATAFTAAMPAPATASAWRCWRAKAPAWSATMISASARHAGDLRERRRRSAASAGEKRRARGSIPRKVKSQSVPVVFRSARSRRACSAISPARFPAPPSRAASRFLKDRMGTGDVRARHHHHRRSASACAACAPSRSTAKASPMRRRALIENGVLTTWLLDCASARQLGLANHRPCRARHRRPALALGHQSLHGSRARFRARRTDRRHQAGLLCHRTDGHGRQWRHRRLQPRRRRLLDREWRDRVSGLGSHHRRQSQGHVRAT